MILRVGRRSANLGQRRIGEPENAAGNPRWQQLGRRAEVLSGSTLRSVQQPMGAREVSEAVK